jgi:hypothetical protein
MPHLNLRQVCLAAPQLESVVDTVRDVFGVDVCYRDPNVAKYGLVNALFVFGRAFLEIVAPTRPETAAGRFIERSGGVGGYMAIFDCSDPEARRARAEQMGVRIAHLLDYDGYWGIQLHPRDCRATMLEFDRTTGGHDLDGPYHPAGERWREFQRLDRVRGIPVIEVESHDPAGLAAHWSKLIDREVLEVEGAREMRFDLGTARFVGAATGTPERLSAMQVQVADPQAALSAAQRRGITVDSGGFMLAGMRIVPVPFAD